MKVITPEGETIDLGTVETAPTIGLTDYSRRVTDAYGVTTITPRGFARRMSVRLAVPFEEVDALQARLADLRATPATWIADDRFASLTVRGFYKDFELDVPGSPICFCRLSIEGLVLTEPLVDAGGDPAAEGERSTLQLLDPIDVTGGVLAATSVPEADHPAWSATTSYPLGARVIVAAMHRVYESATAANVGNDPAGTSGKWIDVGPTNRWAMFDQALGTMTDATAVIEVQLAAPSPVAALAVLDTDAASVRVRAPGYDRTQTVPAAGRVLFLDLAVAAGASVTVTITPAVAGAPRLWNDGDEWNDAATWRDTLTGGSGSVSIGTLLLGALKPLGVTEASPTAAITDYSRKDVDDFGEVTVVERAWAKRMGARALIRTDAIDAVVARVAAVRARPVLWIGDAGLDSLTVYGFFKDFSVEVGENVSKLALTIEGLSKAARVAPLPAGGSTAWPDITDPTGTKPSDNATNTADPSAPFGGGTVGDQIDRTTVLEQQTIPAIDAAIGAANARITGARSAADAAKARADAAFTEIGGQVTRLDERINSVSASGGYDDTAVKAEVTRVDGASLGRDAALGESIQTISASIEDTDTSLRAVIQTKEQAAVGREDAIAQRIDEIIAQGGGGSEGVDTVARAEVSRVEQASIGRDTALGTRLDTVAASFTPGGNWLNNTDFVTRDGWTTVAGVTGATFDINLAGQNNRPVGENVLSIRQLGRVGTDAGYFDWQSAPIAVQPGSYIQFSALCSSHRADTTVHLVWLNALGQFLSFTSGNRNPPTERDAVNPNDYLRSGRLSVLVPATAVGAYLVMRKEDTLPGQGDSYAWFWRPYVGPARAGQNAWNDWSPGKGMAVQLATAARVQETVNALAAEDAAFAERAAVIEATAGQLAGRVTATETAVSDGRFATAQRASAIEAVTGQLAGRITSTETAVTDGRFAAATSVTQLRAEYNGTAATVTQQAGTITGLGQRTAAYVRLIAVAGNNRAQLTLSADANGGAGADLVGDLNVDGNILASGTITARKFNGASMSRMGASSFFGNIAPATGQTIAVPWSLSLGVIPPLGRFIYEYQFDVQTNAGQQTVSAYNGRQLYTNYVADGGLVLSAGDGQGHVYSPRPNGSDPIVGSADFNAVFAASVSRGAYDSGIINDGDYYHRDLSASYFLSRIDLRVTWVAI